MRPHHGEDLTAEYYEELITWSHLAPGHLEPVLSTFINSEIKICNNRIRNEKRTMTYPMDESVCQCEYCIALASFIASSASSFQIQIPVPLLEHVQQELKLALGTHWEYLEFSYQLQKGSIMNLHVDKQGTPIGKTVPQLRILVQTLQDLLFQIRPVGHIKTCSLGKRKRERE